MTRLAADGAAWPRGREAAGTETACHIDRHCITCSDEAVELRVVEVDGDLAICEGDAGTRTTVEIALVAPVTVNDVVLVHAGTAIARAA